MNTDQHITGDDRRKLLDRIVKQFRHGVRRHLVHNGIDTLTGSIGREAP